MAKMLVVMVTCFALISCTSTTVIRTNDNDADIYIDGIPRGKGSVTHSDQKVSGTDRLVRIEKKGCRSESHTVDRSGQLNIGALIGGLFLLIPFLWIVDYEPEYYFQYKCTPEKS